MRIINIPIEPLDMRYTIQWNSWFRSAFMEEFPEVVTLDDIPSSGEIKDGSFLDTIDTNRYKTQQLLKIINILEAYNDVQPLVLFFHDIWFPGLSAIAYIRDGMGFKNLKICGCLHSGGYDPNDFIRNHGMNYWSDLIEQGWFHLVDEIYVATHYHKGVVDDYFGLHQDKVNVTGFPLLQPPVTKQKGLQPTLVFPHRLVPEKHPETFDMLEKHYQDKDWNWVKTMEYKFSKSEYYQVLSNSRIAISAADHENWGIGMQEATLCGAIPLVPNRLSYKELFIRQFRYDTEEEMIQMVEKYMVKSRKTQALLIAQQADIIQKGKNAIPNIIQSIKKLCLPT